MPTLAAIAQRVTALVSSAGACEQAWSAYDYVHNRKRNRLHASRANDLVFVFTNARLIQKFGQPEKFPEWVTEIASDDEKEDAIEFQDPDEQAEQDEADES